MVYAILKRLWPLLLLPSFALGSGIYNPGSASGNAGITVTSQGNTFVNISTMAYGTGNIMATSSFGGTVAINTVNAPNFSSMTVTNGIAVSTMTVSSTTLITGAMGSGQISGPLWIQNTNTGAGDWYTGLNLYNVSSVPPTGSPYFFGLHTGFSPVYWLWTDGSGNPLMELPLVALTSGLVQADANHRLSTSNTIAVSSLTLTQTATFQNGVIASTMTISTETVTGQIVLQDGTILRSTSTLGGSGSGGSGGYNVQPATVTFILAQGLQLTTATASAFNATSTSVTVTGSGGLGVAYGINGSTLALVNASSAFTFTASSSTTGVNLVSISSAAATGPNDFLVSASSSVGTLIFGVTNGGNVISSGTVPSVSSCGTLPSMDQGATNLGGTINTGSGSPTACTLTFANGGFITTPTCVVSDDLQTSEPAITTRSPTGFTLTLGAALSSGHIFYICVGGRGG